MKTLSPGCLTALTIFTATCNANVSLAAEPELNPLYSFETDAEAAKWKAVDGKLKIAPNYATEGKSSLVLETPAWHHGMNEWPVWQVDPEATDWSAYDRAVIDFVNPTPNAELVRFKAADGAYFKIGSAEWPAQSFTIQPRSHLRAVVSLTSWLGAGFDRKNVRQFLFYTARTPTDYVLHIDNISLLKPGQEPAPLSAHFRREINDLRLQNWSLPRAEATLKTIASGIQISSRNDTSAAGQKVTGWAKSSYAALRNSLQKIRQQSVSDELSTEEISKLGDETDGIATRAHRLASLIQLRQKSTALLGSLPYAVGWANSMEKVLPKDRPVPVDVARSKTLDTARNESESIQLVVVPFGQTLKKCRIEFGKFTSPKGVSLAKQSLDFRVVGYVKTRQPAYAVDYVGWWPDPLLDFMTDTDIEPETAQTFWLRVRTPKGQQAGIYSGEVRVVSQDTLTAKLKLSIRVHDFEMPDRSPLLLANQISGAEFFNKYSNEDWITQKIKVADFLSSYYIDYDNIYRMGPPDFDLLKRLRDQGRLSAFTLSSLNQNIFIANMDEAAYQKAFQQLVSEIEPGYQTAKKENILKYAYLYGMDEIPPAQFGTLRRLTADLKAKYPDLPIMTTAQDFSYGKESGAKDIDIWTPIIHEYNLEKAKQARAAGKKVWWYTCQTPSHPYPNVFTEYPSIDLRLLMGFMAIKMQPDGFLYYCLFRDQGPPRTAITSGPFTNWDACAFVEPFNGEGYLAYPGSNGRPPMASIRLENFRDGLEDYAYWKILEATAQKVRKNAPTNAQKAWLQKADKLLTVPDSMVKSAFEFTKEPEAVYSYRQQLLKLIDESGTRAAIPQWPGLN